MTIRDRQRKKTKVIGGSCERSKKSYLKKNGADHAGQQRKFEAINAQMQGHETSSSGEGAPLNAVTSQTTQLHASGEGNGPLKETILGVGGGRPHKGVPRLDKYNGLTRIKWPLPMSYQPWARPR